MKPLLALLSLCAVLFFYTIKHEQKYKVGACVLVGGDIMKIIEETDTEFVLENKYLRIMDKKTIIRRYFRITSCKS